MNTPINNLIFNETGCIRKDQLLRYRDQQLSSSERHLVEEHLVDCALCSDALEGLALISSTATLDSLQKEIPGLVTPAAGHSFRPWLAAATIAGVVLFSYFTYVQFKNVKEERLAVYEENIPDTKKEVIVPGTPAEIADTAPVAVTESATQIDREEKLPVQKEVIAKDQIYEEVTQETVAPASEAVPITAEQGASVAKMEIPAAVTNSIAPYSTAIKNTGNQNITYVDNVKVIDYNDYGIDNTRQADVPRSTKSKYQNQTAATEAEQKSTDGKKRKDDYLDLVADPLILFNNGRYESANSGFDKLLKLNKADQNAAFYKGLSLYNMKQFDPALEMLEPISNDSTSPFMEEAQFYTAQSYIKNGSVPQGKIILENLSNSNGFYSGKAKEELKKIK